MSFKSLLLARFDEKYKEDLFLENTFEILSNNLKSFRKELTKYPDMEVDLREEHNMIKMILQGEMIKFDLDFDYMKIQVISDDDENNDMKVIDTITFTNKGKGISAFWNIGAEKAFDYYLEKAFENIVN